MARGELPARSDRSRTTHGIRRMPSSIAMASPTGPPPTIKTPRTAIGLPHDSASRPRPSERHGTDRQPARQPARGRGVAHERRRPDDHSHDGDALDLPGPVGPRADACTVTRHREHRSPTNSSTRSPMSLSGATTSRSCGPEVVDAVDHVRVWRHRRWSRCVIASRHPPADLAHRARARLVRAIELPGGDVGRSGTRGFGAATEGTTPAGRARNTGRPAHTLSMPARRYSHARNPTTRHPDRHFLQQDAWRSW